MRRLTTRTLPAAPSDWDASSTEVWNKLIRVLEDSNLFDQGRRTRPAFIVKGTVSAAVTVDLASPNVSVLTHQVGKLLMALQASNYLDVREDL